MRVEWHRHYSESDERDLGLESLCGRTFICMPLTKEVVAELHDCYPAQRVGDVKSQRVDCLNEGRNAISKQF